MAASHPRAALPTNPSSSGGRFVIALVDLDQPEHIAHRLEHLLPVHEVMELSRAHAAGRRVVARAALRDLIAEAAGIPPGALSIVRSGSGKPYLDTGTEDVANTYFSLAEADDLCVVAVGEKPVGVDIEKVVPRDFEPAASALFSPHEARQWRCGGRSLRMAYRAWTAKEAYLKATGIGLRCPLPLITIALDDDPAFVELPAEIAEDWSLHFFEPADGCIGAVVVRGPAAEISVRHWTPPTWERQ